MSFLCLDWFLTWPTVVDPPSCGLSGGHWLSCAGMFPRAVLCLTTIGRWNGPLCQKWSLPVYRNRKPIDLGKLWPPLSSWCLEWGSPSAIAKTYQRSSTSRRNPETEVEGPPNWCWWIWTASLGLLTSRAAPEHASESWLSSKRGTLLPISPRPSWDRAKQIVPLLALLLLWPRDVIGCGEPGKWCSGTLLGPMALDVLGKRHRGACGHWFPHLGGEGSLSRS